MRYLATILVGLAAPLSCGIGAASAQPGILLPAHASTPASEKSEAGRTAASASREVLLDFGIEPTVEGLREYFEALEPSPDEAQRIARLVKQLGDADFFRREAAMAELYRLPSISREQLEQAAQGDDAEIRWRAARLIDHGRSTSIRLLNAAYSTIEEAPIKGLAEQVLRSMNHCREEFQFRAARRAVAATAIPEDLPVLRTEIDGNSTPRRLAAVTALVELLGDEAYPELEPLLADDDDQVRFHSAYVLANAGSRKSLPVLGELLDSDDLKIRARASQTLRAITGKRIPFVAYETADKRHSAVREWREWIAEHGDDAELDTPVDLVGPIFNHTLVCYYNGNKVVELDATGKLVWQQQIGSPWGCQGLPNGNRLVASYNEQTVIEFDPQGEEIWKTKLAGRPFSVQRIENGNTLVSCYGNRSIVEIRPDKTIAWKIDTPGQPMDAQRLPNGNTLACLYDKQKVVEFDRAGKIVWELPNMPGPRSAQRLENGNTLVVQSNAHKVVEFDRGKHEVWSKKLGTNVFDVQRLPNGHTLIGDQQGVKELDVEGHTIWKHDGKYVGRLHRF